MFTVLTGSGITQKSLIEKRMLEGGFLKKAINEARWKYVSKKFTDIIKSEFDSGTLKAHSPKSKGFYIYGMNGTGKTFLLHLIAERLFSKYNYHYLIYIRYTDLLKMFFHYWQNYLELINIKMSPVLFIDEFGKGNDNDFYLSHLEDIFEYRLMNYLPTYLASNYSIEYIAERGMKSIADRLSESKTFRTINYGTQSKRV